MPDHDRRALRRVGTILLGLMAFPGCASDVPPGRPGPRPAATSLASVVESALDDATRRTGIARSQLELLGAEAVTWSDGSLGCPQPGMMYTQALVPGYRVRIRAGGEVLDYHAGRSGPAAPCPADRAQPPLPAQDT